MIPTLQIGDFILVNKFTYGIRLPVVNKKIVDLGDPKRGDVVVLSNDSYDTHRVENAVEGRTSISIHVYGANIGAVKRAMFNAETSQPEYFISGYDNRTVPNLWDLSRAAH